MISVVIVNYFSASELPNCLSSLQPSIHELIIVDNSVDASEKEALESLTQTHTIAHLVFNPKNVGFAKAVNQGAKLATGEALLLLNPDAYFTKGSLDLLLNKLNNVDVAAVGPLITFADGSEQAGGRRLDPTPARSFAKLFGLSRLGLLKDHNLAGTPLPASAEAVEALSGACMLIKTDIFWQLGGFDEAYTMHCEDLDFCMAARLAGYNLLFVPSAQLIHKKGHSSAKRPLWVEWQLHKGMIIYYQKFFKKRYSPLLWPLIVLGVYARFGILSLLHLGAQGVSYLKAYLKLEQSTP